MVGTMGRPVSPMTSVQTVRRVSPMTPVFRLVAADPQRRGWSVSLGTQCGNGLFCATDRSTGDGVCEPFPSDCPTPPTCDCALAVCARLGGSSCSVGVLDDPASSITVSCAGGVGPQAMDAGVDAMIEDEIEPIALPFVVDDHFTEHIEVSRTGGFLEKFPARIGRTLWVTAIDLCGAGIGGTKAERIFVGFAWERS